MAASIAEADVLIRTSEPVVSVSDTASFSLSNPPPYNLASQFTYPFVNLYFNSNVGTLDSVSADFEVSIPVFVFGESQSVFAAGDTATMAIGGTAGAQVRLEAEVLDLAVVPYTRDCTIIGNGDGIPDSCTIGDGAQVGSAPAGVLAISHTQTFSGVELAPFLINDSQPRMFLDVDVSGVATADVSSAAIWARTFGVDGARVLLTLTYHYTPGPADTDADGVGDSIDNCALVYNPAQLDTNGDNIGNICDADFNGDCIVNSVDLGILKTVFFTPDADADLNGDGIVNAIDLGLMKTLFFLPPGPSGQPNDCS